MQETDTAGDWDANYFSLKVKNYSYACARACVVCVCAHVRVCARVCVFLWCLLV